MIDDCVVEIDEMGLVDAIENGTAFVDGAFESFNEIDESADCG